MFKMYQNYRNAHISDDLQVGRWHIAHLAVSFHPLRATSARCPRSSSNRVSPSFTSSSIFQLDSPGCSRVSQASELLDVFSSHPCYLWNCYLVSSLLRTSTFPSPPLLPVLPLDPLFLLFFLPVTVQLQMSYKPLFYQLRGHSSVT